MSETYMTRRDEGIGEGLTDSIRWIFETHIEEEDAGEYNFAMLHGNNDAPEKIELWKNEPNFDTPPDRIWEPGVIRPYGPGKFDTILDSYVYSVSLDGGCDEEEGSVSETGAWYGIMRNGRTIFRDHDPMLESLNPAEQKLLTSSAGVILSEDSNGFVYVQYFDSKDKLEQEWTKISLAHQTEEDSEEEES